MGKKLLFIPIVLTLLFIFVIAWAYFIRGDYNSLRVDFIDLGKGNIQIQVCNESLLWVYYNDSFIGTQKLPYGTSVEYIRAKDGQMVFLWDPFPAAGDFKNMWQGGLMAPWACKSREADVYRILGREEGIKVHDPDNPIGRYRLHFRIFKDTPILRFYNPKDDPQPFIEPDFDRENTKDFYSPWYEYKPYKQGAP